MKLEVQWAGAHHPRQAKIHNVDIVNDSDKNGFEQAYVAFSGYYGPYAPDMFAAAPDMYGALDAVLERYTELANSGDAGFWDCELEEEVIAARAALAKARGEK